MLNGKVRLDSKDSNSVFTTVGSVDESAIAGETNSRRPVVGSPVGRDSLDCLNMGEAGVLGVVLKDFQLAAQFAQNIGILAIRMESNVTGAKTSSHL